MDDSEIGRFRVLRRVLKDLQKVHDALDVCIGHPGCNWQISDMTDGPLGVWAATWLIARGLLVDGLWMYWGREPVTACHSVVAHELNDLGFIFNHYRKAQHIGHCVRGDSEA